MSFGIDLCLLLLNILNVAFHFTGIALLVSYSKSCRSKNASKCHQHFYLINLSISEGTLNAFEAVRLILQHSTESSSKTIERIRYYLLIINFTGVWIVVVFTLFGMTIDRLLCITLELQYQAYWNRSKSKRLLLIGWFISCLICIFVTIANHFELFDWEKVFFLYVYNCINAAFISLSVITYILIFKKYRSSQTFRANSTVRPRSNMYSTDNIANISKRRRTNLKRKEFSSSFFVFIKSRFYIPIMLVLTYILFITIPDLIYLIYGRHAEPEIQNRILSGCWISYAIGNMSDVVIYVFLQPSIRRTLQQKLSCCFKRDLDVRISTFSSSLTIPLSIASRNSSTQN